MIPELNEDGYLPPGIHRATLEEIAARFGQESEVRQVQMQSLCWLVDLALRAGVERLIINGSFVTGVFEPNDVDCVLLIGPTFPRGTASEAELLVGLPFLHIALAVQRDFDVVVQKVFATDRYGVAKGVIEVIL